MTPAVAARPAAASRRAERRGGRGCDGAQLSLDASPAAAPEAPAPPQRLAAAPGRTLADVLAGAWNELAAHRAVACLVCGAAMTPRYGAATAAPAGGRCSACGSTLS